MTTIALEPGPLQIAPPKRLVRSTIEVGILGVAGRLGLAFRDVLLAKTYGAGADIDAFAVAQAVPLFLVVMSAAAMTAAIVPRLVHLLEDGQEDRASQVLVRIVILTVLASTALAATVLTFRGTILAVLGSGFSSETRESAAELLAISSPAILAGGVLAVLTAGLHAQHRFRIVAAAPAANMAVVLSWLVLSNGRGGVKGVAAIAVVGTLVELGIVAVALHRSALRIRMRLSAVDGEVRAILGQALPLIGSSVVMASTPLVDQAIAASQATGSVARMAYGTKAVSFIVGTLAMALGTTMLPTFARFMAKGDVASLRSLLRRWLLWIVGAGTLLATAVALLSRPIVTLAFERGSFTGADSEAVAAIQAVAVFQLPFYLVGIVLVRLLSAAGRNRSLLGITVLAAVVNVVTDFFFVDVFGLPGIALSTVCVYGSAAALSLVLVRRTLRALQEAQDARFTVSAGAALC